MIKTLKSKDADAKSRKIEPLTFNFCRFEHFENAKLLFSPFLSNFDKVNF